MALSKQSANGRKAPSRRRTAATARRPRRFPGFGFGSGRGRARQSAVRVTTAAATARASWWRAWLERALPEISLCFTVAIALYLLACLGGEVSGWTRTGDAAPVQNFGGRFGATVADFLYDVLGRAAAWALPLLLAVRAWRVFRERRTQRSGLGRRLLVLACFVAALLSLSLIENLRAFNLGMLGEAGLRGGGHPGGIIGDIIGGALQPSLGVPGGPVALAATMAALLVFLLLLTVTTRLSWLRLMDRIGAVVWWALPRKRSPVVSGRRVRRTATESGAEPVAVSAAESAPAAGERGLARLKPRWLSRPRQTLRGRPTRIEPMMHTPGGAAAALHSTASAPHLAASAPHSAASAPHLTASAPHSTASAPHSTASASAIRSVPAPAAKPARARPGARRLPSLELLDQPTAAGQGYSEAELKAKSQLLEARLADFNIEAHVVDIYPGPVITSFEIEPAPGIKLSQITNLARDLARALSVVSLRVVENIPGKTSVGIEIPNQARELVMLREGVASRPYTQSPSPLAMVLGKDIGGRPVVADLERMPHLLVAGATGSGKSVCINALILSVLYKALPEQVRLILVDPKLLELSIYDGIPHLLAPVVTDMQQAGNALRWSIAEMERRYRTMAALGVRNIANYNAKVRQAAADGEPLRDPLAVVDGEGGEGGAVPLLEAQPYIVIVIDELADLMMVAGKKMEVLITRIAQRARAAGIHLVLATQRPSVDVVTGLIKANVPGRIAFQMAARVDSRTVLDRMGAEQLLGRGDMLFLSGNDSIPRRVHGSFVSDHEVHRVVEALKEQGPPVYDDNVTEPQPEAAADGAAGDGGAGGEEDPLYDQALRVVTETRRPSISLVQRHLRIGYNRAARLIEAMEKAGAVGPPQENGKREVLAPPPVAS